MNGKVFLLCPESDRSIGLFEDIDGQKDVIVRYVSLKHPLYKYIRKIVYKARFFKVHLPMPRWIYDINLDGLNNCSHLVVRSNVLEMFPITKVQEIRKLGIRCILLLLDSLDVQSGTFKETRAFIDKKYWEEIITFDPKDARTYGYTLRNDFHSIVKVKSTPDIAASDIYCICSSKGNRSKLLSDIYTVLSSNGVRCSFDFLFSNYKEKLPVEGINQFRKSIQYDEVLQKVSKTNCILELLQCHQEGPSLRYFEAIFYNKKLLTNNPDTVHFPYYNPDYMKIVSSAEDIDIDWLTRVENIDYHYAGDFSPVHFIEYILENTNNITSNDN